MTSQVQLRVRRCSPDGGAATVFCAAGVFAAAPHLQPPRPCSRCPSLATGLHTRKQRRMKRTRAAREVQTAHGSGKVVYGQRRADARQRKGGAPSLCSADAHGHWGARHHKGRCAPAESVPSRLGKSPQRCCASPRAVLTPELRLRHLAHRRQLRQHVQIA